ncbi:MAG: transposase [Deltaproteobacteria bacterium]|nr:transposase [Deltaproteobacteria bacterium]
MKYEVVYTRDYERVEELVKELRTYFKFYNNKRPHQTLGGKTPRTGFTGVPRH